MKFEKPKKNWDKNAIKPKLSTWIVSSGWYLMMGRSKQIKEKKTIKTMSDERRTKTNEIICNNFYEFHIKLITMQLVERITSAPRLSFINDVLLGWTPPNQFTYNGHDVCQLNTMSCSRVHACVCVSVYVCMWVCGNILAVIRKLLWMFGFPHPSRSVDSPLKGNGGWQSFIYIVWTVAIIRIETNYSWTNCTWELSWTELCRATDGDWT